MASENLAIDGNMRNALGAVTNDSNEFIERLRVNPITGALICEATVTSTNTSIGSTIPGGTEGSVLFIGPGGTLAQDNANFFWDDVDVRLGLGTDTPSETLDVEGTTRLNDGSAQIGYVFTATDTLGTGTWMPAGGGGGGVTQIINTDTFITISPGGGTGIVTLGIDIANLTSDSTFITDVATSLIADTTFLSNLANSTTFVTDLIANTTFTTDLANDSNFITTLTNNSTFINDVVTQITNIGGGIVQSVTDDGNGQVSVDNTDPKNPIIDFIGVVTDGTIITGTGLGGSPITAGLIPVANGGTGDTSLTAFAPLFGGTTTTAPIQSGTVGTAGQVLTSNGAGALPTFQTLSTRPSEQFITPGTYTWVAPAGVTSVLVDLLGGGGSGGAGSDAGSSNDAGGGGGGGGQAMSQMSSIVVPYTAYTITVGQGGASVGAGADGNPGTSSTFNGLTALPGDGGLAGLDATGGAGGAAGDATAGAGGAGGSSGGAGTNGGTGTGGGTGGIGGNASGFGSGGGGGASGFGATGGDGATGSSTAATDGVLGSGGGGGRGNGGGGAAGGGGFVIIYY